MLLGVRDTMPLILPHWLVPGIGEKEEKVDPGVGCLIDQGSTTPGPQPIQNWALEIGEHAHSRNSTCACSGWVSMHTQLHLYEQQMRVPTTCANGAVGTLAHRSCWNHLLFPSPWQSTKPERLETVIIDHFP